MPLSAPLLAAAACSLAAVPVQWKVLMSEPWYPETEVGPRGFTTPLRAGAELSGPYIDPSSVSWIFIEWAFLLLFLEAVYHAHRHRQRGILCCGLLFGAIVEAHSYYMGWLQHRKAVVMFTNFLPLKEVLWYGLNFYTVNVMLSCTDTGLGWIGMSAAGAVLYQMSTLPYLWRGGRNYPQYQAYIVNRHYAWADFTEHEEWHGGLCAMFYHHLWMGAAVAGVTHYIRSSGAGFFRSVAYMAAAAVCTCVAVSIPYHGLKRLGCVFQALPGGLLESQRWCVKTSAITDCMVWAVTLAGFVALAFAAVCVYNEPRGIPQMVTVTGHLRATVFLYHLVATCAVLMTAEAIFTEKKTMYYSIVSTCILPLFVCQCMVHKCRRLAAAPVPRPPSIQAAGPAPAIAPGGGLGGAPLLIGPAAGGGGGHAG
eukprot:TRINITY_DN19966_c0_g1_i1.p1 TRINITY_DN19966_c0_g1~~TRINITY_DN19966_c0_g1_i1.p1  ORF type:complete len:424 (+),score=80.18 TRINITY_DN19966_c0_g1_i1:85-1356(+)